MALPPVYVVSARRTPIGAFQGAFSELAAPKLGSVAIAAALESAKVSADAIQQVFMGNVLSAGIGQAPARQASLGAGIPNKVPCVTVSKVCGSGLESIVLATKAIALGDADLVVAGGMESMTNVPYYLTKARGGYRMGHGQMLDGMIHDGLWDPYKNFHMGVAGELCAREYKFTREAQDEYAKESFRRALAAQKESRFDAEIAPVSVAQKKGDALVIKEDEGPKKGDPAKMSALKPAFDKEGTITAANASSINDGAAAVVLASEAAVKAHGLTPIARILGYGAAAQAPEWFTTAPVAAIKDVSARTGVAVADVGLFEINEAFAVVAMAAMRDCELDHGKVNVHGGAIALGHPIGASGARIFATMVHAMKSRGVARGLSTLCIGGGEAVAVIAELV
ncbi:MAG: acetyl-CoA C-acyltransferase [Myxococcales bacterium]|nr:acetyl-CoA C-acyltransferase [Myxococcales bacterium]